MKEKYISVDKFVLIMVYVVSLLRITHIQYYGNIKNILSMIILLYAIVNLSYVKKQYHSINKIVGVFGCWIILSAFVNRNRVVFFNPPKSALFFSITLMGIFLSLEILVNKIGFDKIIDTFKYCAIFICAITDICIFFNLFTVYGQGLPLYIIGTKFSVMYQHLILLSFLLLDNKMHHKNSRIYIVIFGVIYLIVGLKVDCVTGLVGGILYIALLCLGKKNKKILYSPIIILLAEAIAFSYVFVGVSIMNNIYVLSFVDNYMGGAETMLARIQIYEMALLAISKVPFWGYGYYTTYELGMKMGKFANTQNSLLDWIWQGGIPAAIFILYIIYRIILLVQRKYKLEDSLCENFVVLLLVYIILGSVEILIELPFFTILGILLISTDDSVKIEENNIEKNMFYYSR